MRIIFKATGILYSRVLTWAWMNFHDNGDGIEQGYDFDEYFQSDFASENDMKTYMFISGSIRNQLWNAYPWIWYSECYRNEYKFEDEDYEDGQSIERAPRLPFYSSSNILKTIENMSEIDVNMSRCFHLILMETIEEHNCKSCVC